MAIENEQCPGCGAEIIQALWANKSVEPLLPIDAERYEGGRIILVHKATGGPPWVWFLDNGELDKSRSEHEAKVKQGIEEPGPHKLFRFHDCRRTAL